jgi:hypothetical protein
MGAETDRWGQPITDREKLGLPTDRCSFCGEFESSTLTLIQGPSTCICGDDLFICGTCVETCAKMLSAPRTE